MLNMDKNKCVIELRNVSIYHTNGNAKHPKKEDELVLSDVNLRVEAGEMVYFIGRVGSGKSTLLKTLYAEVQLLEGQGRVVGVDLRKIKRSEVPHLRRKMGIVFQDYQLLDASDGERLERWGKYILIRPDPQIIWKGAARHPAWKKADGIYRSLHYIIKYKGYYIEIQGARNVKRLMPEAVLIYILPPSIDELKRRLIGRNTEDEETIAGRLHTARLELNEAPELYDYFIVNDLVDNAAIKIKDIIEGERCSKNAMQEVLKQILEEAENLA